MVAGLPESVARLTDQLAAGLLLATAITAILRPVRGLLFFNAAWMVAISIALYANPGSTVDSLAPISHAARFTAPLGLALLLIQPKNPSGQDVPTGTYGLCLLHLGVSATFFGHGLEALEHYGRFVDLIIGSAHRWLDLTLSQSTAENILTVIGVQDIFLAGLLLYTFIDDRLGVFRRWRWIAGWMAVWGLCTALSRMTAGGIDSWHKTLIRSANGGVPLALFLGWWHLGRPPIKNAKP